MVEAEKLKPLYKDLLEHVSNHEDAKSSFCVQWGKNFPTESHSGILFVGKAVNGWVDKNDTEPKTVERIFDDKENPVFNRDDQMEWVEKSWRSKVQWEKGPDGKKHIKEGNYYTKRSPFWRVIRDVSIRWVKNNYPMEKNPEENWWSYVAWTNLYKISPESYNPDSNLRDDQFVDCVKILETELRILSPKFVVFLTGDWADRFIKNEEFLKELKPIKEKAPEKWGNDGKNIYEDRVYEIGEYVCIISLHPQGKPERKQKESLKKIILRY